MSSHSIVLGGEGPQEGSCIRRFDLEGTC